MARMPRRGRMGRKGPPTKPRKGFNDTAKAGPKRMGPPPPAASPMGPPAMPSPIAPALPPGAIPNMSVPQA